MGMARHRENCAKQALISKGTSHGEDPKKALIAVIATLATGFLLLLFVFIRQALCNMGRNEETAQKLSSLKTSWHKALGKASHG